MIFVFHEYVDFLIATGRQNNLALSYINRVEDFMSMKDFKETKPYHDYVSKFPVFEFMIPGGDQLNDTWKLLLQLALASPSTWVKVSMGKQDLLRVAISVRGIVDGKEKRISRSIHRLYSFQVYRIFEIFLDELFTQEVSKHQDPLDCMIIDELREKRIERANRIKK